MDSRTQFSFTEFDARGTAVRLESSWQEVQARNELPQPAQQLLGEALVAVSLMISNLKLEGRVSLQLQGGHSLSLLLAECHSNGMVRGVATIHDDIAADVDFGSLTQDATMAITIEPDEGQRYQGIVPMTGTSLAESLEGYFAQSEQLDTRLWLFADQQHAAGMLLQKLPEQRGDDDPDGWNRIGMLAETLTADEMLSLPVADVIHRLFHRENLQTGPASALKFGCSCSRDRVIGVLTMLGRDEVLDAVEQDALQVSCEFCNECYRFDRIDLEQLFANYTVDGPSTLQ